MKKAALALIVFLISLGLKAQFNVHELGRKDIYFGIALGVNVGDFKVIHSKRQAINDSIRYFKPLLWWLPRKGSILCLTY